MVMQGNQGCKLGLHLNSFIKPLVSQNQVVDGQNTKLMTWQQ